MTQHDGSVLRLRKLDEDYDPSDRIAALTLPAGAQAAKGEIVTGLLYVDPDAKDLHDAWARYAAERTRHAELMPVTTALDKINASLR